MTAATAPQRRLARKLVKLANEQNAWVTYSLPDEILTGESGNYRYFLVNAESRRDGRRWKYCISQCYDGTRGWMAE